MTITEVQSRCHNHSEYLWLHFLTADDEVFRVNTAHIQEIIHPTEHSTLIEIHLFGRGTFIVPFPEATDAAGFARRYNPEKLSPYGETLYCYKEPSHAPA